MRPVLHTFFVFLSVFFINTNILRAQDKIQITKTDEAKIKRQAKEVVESLQTEYNFFLTSKTADRKFEVKSLTTPGSPTRLFLSDRIIIENDFNDRETAGLPEKERDKTFEDYVDAMGRKYGLGDNDEEPNAGKAVTISNVSFSRIQAVSKDSLFIKALFKISYDGTARNGFRFKDTQRVAQIRLERDGKNWRAFIESITFFTDIRDLENKSHQKNVFVVEDKALEAIKYEEAISAQTKTVNRSPLLKAFMINDLWGLLNDEDQQKKILIQPKFCEINEFPEEEKLALVCLDGSWGYINREGSIELACQYDIAESFKNGKAKVQKGVKRFTIDVKGKEVK